MVTVSSLRRCFNAEKFASDIRNARRGRGLTLRQMAEEFGKSHVLISKWENCQAEPKLDDFFCLCYGFDLDANWYLVSPDDYMKTEEMF